MKKRPLRLSGKRRPAARGFANDLRNIAPDARKAVGEALRSATRQIVSELYQASPAYSGKFRTKWYSQVEGKSNKVFVATGVPRLTDEDMRKGAPTILIGNTSPYAQEAMDLIPGKFIRQEEGPVKSPVAVGRRVGAFRGDVIDSDIDDILEAGGRPAISTAEEKWYTTYMEGGGFSEAFRQGAKTGFIRPASKQ
jgi:hypothetical protein